MLVQCKPIWSLKSLQIWSSDPMCQMRKISSLFGTLGHKESKITHLWVPVSLICHFGHLNWNSTFCVKFWVSAPLKSCLKVVRLAKYVGIFQFYCTWKFENCRILHLKEQFVYKNSEVSCSCMIGWKKYSTWPSAHLICGVFWFCFEMVYCMFCNLHHFGN